MSNFLTFSELDTEIQSRMQNSAPDQTKRLAAINGAAQNIAAEFDIQSSKREVVFYAVPDGTSIKLSDIVPDFKNVSNLGYLSNGASVIDYRRIEDDAFLLHQSQSVLYDEFTVSYNNGEQFVKINSINGFESTQLHSNTSLTDNGTWAVDDVTSDALNLSVNNVNTIDSTGAIQFDVDVTQSANNYALVENSNITSVDLSSYLGLGKTRMWVHVPSVTNFTSITFRWGSDASNYYYKTVTAQRDGSSFIVGPNSLEFDWSTATTVGTPDVTDISYIALQFNYSASYTSQVAFRFEEMVTYLPIPYKLTYFTSYLSKTSAGVFQEFLTTTASDELLIPKRFKNIVVLESLKTLWPMSMGQDATPYLNLVYADFNREKKKLSDSGIGEKPKKNVPKIKIHNPLD